MKVVLNLTMMGEWFEMVSREVKREEYRELDNAQVRRAIREAICDEDLRRKRLVAVFRNGYSMESRAMAVEVTGFEIREGGAAKHPEWGEPEAAGHYVIKLGEVLRRGAYREVKEWLDKDRALGEKRRRGE